MWRPYGPRFRAPRAMMCCGPWGWHPPTKEERLEWLRAYKEDLERELAEVAKEIERTQQEPAQT